MKNSFVFEKAAYEDNRLSVKKTIDKLRNPQQLHKGGDRPHEKKGPPKILKRRLGGHDDLIYLDRTFGN